jgi:uncharacterized membrane protein HdeD (DUF308 family)
MSAERDPAAARFAVLQLVRLSGAVMLLLGVLLLSGEVAWLPRLPDVVGYVLIAIGIFEFFVVPLFLTRRWRS